MKLEKSEFIFLISFLMRGFFFGPCISIVYGIALNNSWISIVLSFILGFVPLFIFYKLFMIGGDNNIIDLFNKNLLFGRLISCAITLFIVYFCGISLWNVSNFVKSQFLFKTPLLAIGILFCVASLIMAKNNIRTIGRSGIIYFCINFILFNLALFSLSEKVRFDYFLPFESTSFIEIINASLISVSYNVLPLFLLLIVPRNNLVNSSGLVKSGLIMYCFTFFCILMVIATGTAILGANLCNLYQFTEYHILKTINIANFFQRVEGILSLQWIFDCIMLMVLCMHFTKCSVKQIFNFENNNLILVIVGIFVLFISRNIFDNNTVALDFLTKYQPFLNLFFLLILPSILLLKIKLFGVKLE